MKVCYLAHIRLPSEKAHGAQIVKTCEALSEAGAEVSLLVPGRKTSVAGDAFSFYGAKENFRIVSLNTPDVVSLGPLGFGLSLLLFSEVAKWRKEFWTADIIYSRDAFVLLQYVLLGRKFVYEAHMKPTVISRMVAKRAHRLVVISGGLKDAYIRLGVREERVVVAHDAIDPALYREQFSKEDVRKELGLPLDAKIALYVGRFDEAKGAHTFAASSDYTPEDTLVVLIGDGPLKDSLIRRYPKARILPPTRYKELPRVLSASDVLVLPNSAKDEDASRYTSPLKAFAYLASGKPIVASDVPALREILEGKATFFVPDDAKALGKVLSAASPSGATPEDYSWAIRAKTILTGV